MLEVLNPTIVSQTVVLRQAFDSARPFRHLAIDDFLQPEFLRELMAGFPRFDEERARNEMGLVGRKAVFAGVANLGCAYARFDALMRAPEFLTLMGRLTGIDDLLYDPEYVGGGTHENLSGQDLDAHVDFNFHPNTHWHRRLNLIVFLNPEWRAEWGGVLELHRNPALGPESDEIRGIVPVANRCAIFETTEHSWHGFRRIEAPADISRRSVAVYFYTKKRARKETAPDHGTFYVQRPLPPRIVTGHTLTEGDVQEIRNLLARRDTQIKFLYEREMEMSKSRAVRLVRWLGGPLRKLRGAWNAR